MEGYVGMFWLGLCIGVAVADIGVLVTLALCYASKRAFKSNDRGENDGDDQSL